MKLLKQSIIASAIALGISTSASAATLSVSNGILMGASDVKVSGEFYDVTFKDGTLGSGISAFTTLDSANAASQALLDQVFTGVYGSNPEKTNGCTFTAACYAFTSYSISSGKAYYSIAANMSGTGTDSINNWNNTASTDTSSNIGYTLAIWTKKDTTATAVPEPEAYAMMLAGLGLVGFAARRKKQATKSKVLSQY